MLGKLEKIGVVVLVIFIGLAIISLVLPVIDRMYHPLTGTDPEIIGYSSPSSHHILGTDFMGRDLFSQLCSGAYWALVLGVMRAVVGIVVLVIVASIMASIRKETPHLEDTPLVRYTRFVAVPFGVTGIVLALSLVVGSVLGRLAWISGILLFGPLVGFIGWLAVGHDLEVKFRKGEKIPGKLLLSGGALIISYVTIETAVLTFIGVGDPTTVTWGMMIEWCFLSGYTFRAMHWLLPPIICTYVFSRGMLALSYGLYNSGAEKYFFKEDWF